MKAKVFQEGDITVVKVSGQIDYETVDPFRETCLNRFRGTKLVFNLQNLDFVGSTGITQFVGTIEELAQTNPDGIRVCEVSSEFEKILLSNEIKGLQIYSDQQSAQQSFSPVIIPDPTPQSTPVY